MDVKLSCNKITKCMSHFINMAIECHCSPAIGSTNTKHFRELCHPLANFQGVKRAFGSLAYSMYL